MRRRNWTDQPGNGGASLTTSFNLPVSVHLINFLSHVLIIGWQVAKPTPDLFTDIRKERKKIESIPTYLPIYLPACHIPHN
ncbi:hypothetical protein T02_16385 [Trichinella nativa]|uniref:Uncharacterized protein n=1 Tax=Trichinella nativa TaxID=6335 RepID=A0A0V1KWZ7_9BILA|nr:hypothetical protein T02_16385 [Trichinella nativa]